MGLRRALQMLCAMDTAFHIRPWQPVRVCPVGMVNTCSLVESSRFQQSWVETLNPGPAKYLYSGNDGDRSVSVGFLNAPCTVLAQCLA